MNGFVRKNIIHPYSGSSPDSLEYVRGVRIDPFVDVRNIKIFRSKLIDAAQKIKLYLDTYKEKIIEIVSDETGSPIFYHMEDMKTAIAFLEKIHLIEKVLPKKYLYEPKGNILLIFSANEPIILATILIFSSLFMGNTVFVKPSSKTPSYSYFLVKKLAKISMFKKRIHYLLINKEETERLIKTRIFDFVLSFASRSTNKKLGAICADSEVEFLQESEGNDWVYIDKDCGFHANISRIVIKSFTRHNGQMCNSVRGILIHSSLYDIFVKLLKNTLSNVSVGSPHIMKTRIGALLAGTSARADFIVQKSSAKTDNVLNFSIKNNVITPSLILNPDNASSIFSESIFAPVLWVKKVKSFSEALSFYRKKNLHGLGFSVFSSDKKIVSKFVNNIKAGRININKNPLHTGVFDPLGGIKLSGYGGPSHWVEKVSNRKYINRSAV